MWFHAAEVEIRVPQKILSVTTAPPFDQFTLKVYVD